MSDTPSTLNPAQLEAVYHLSGPCLVLAGAGSGTTRVIVHKIAKLLQSGLEARQIAAITFTNKAAQEMRERAKALVGSRAAKELAISTFHSLGVRLLRADGARIGLKPNFSILDATDVLGVLKDAGATTDNAMRSNGEPSVHGARVHELDGRYEDGRRRCTLCAYLGTRPRSDAKPAFLHAEVIASISAATSIGSAAAICAAEKPNRQHSKTTLSNGSCGSANVLEAE